MLLSLCWQKATTGEESGRGSAPRPGAGVRASRIHLGSPHSPTSAPGTCSPRPRGAHGASPGPSRLTCQIFTFRWAVASQRARRDSARPSGLTPAQRPVRPRPKAHGPGAPPASPPLAPPAAVSGEPRTSFPPTPPQPAADTAAFHSPPAPLPAPLSPAGRHRAEAPPRAR